MIRADAVLTPPVSPGTVSLGERAVPFGGGSRRTPMAAEQRSSEPVTVGSHTWGSAVLWHWTESQLRPTVSAPKPPLIWRTRSPRFLLTPQNITSPYPNLTVPVFSTESTPADSPGDLTLPLRFRQGLKSATRPRRGGRPAPVPSRSSGGRMSGQKGDLKMASVTRKLRFCITPRARFPRPHPSFPSAVRSCRPPGVTPGLADSLGQPVGSRVCVEEMGLFES